MKRLAAALLALLGAVALAAPIAIVGNPAARLYVSLEQGGGGDPGGEDPGGGGEEPGGDEEAPGAACTRYIRQGASGSGNGLDWTNAYSSVPTTLIRGEVYCIADGTYGSVTFNTANSGTSTITIQKATVAYHGTNTGWSDSYGDGQAVFSNITVTTDYWVFDGKVRNTDWRTGGIDKYGIRFKSSGSAKTIRLDNGGGQGADNIIFRYVDVEASGRDTGTGTDAIYGLTGNSNVTFEYCAVHDTDRTLFLMRGNWVNLTVRHCYLARNTNTNAEHGELMSSTSATNMVWANNVIEDIEGTAIWAGLNNGTWTDSYFYGNTITHTSNYTTGRTCTGGRCNGVAGVIYVANDASNANSASGTRFYNNTLVNLTGLWSGVYIEAGSNNEVRNNIWYNAPRTGSAGVGTFSHNWYYNTSPQDGDSSGTKTVCTTSCSIFVNASARDFRLAVPIAGTSLGSPYDVDSYGNTRGADGTWDRGALEYVEAQ